MFFMHLFYHILLDLSSVLYSFVEKVNAVNLTSAPIKDTETQHLPINLMGNKKVVREVKTVFVDVIEELKERGIL